MIDIFCPHCGFELTEAEVRRWTASLNGRRPKKREKMLAETPNVEAEGFPDTVPMARAQNDVVRYAALAKDVTRHLAGMLCKHQRPKHLCLACERGRR